MLLMPVVKRWRRHNKLVLQGCMQDRQRCCKHRVTLCSNDYRLIHWRWLEQKRLRKSSTGQPCSSASYINVVIIVAAVVVVSVIIVVEVLVHGCRRRRRHRHDGGHAWAWSRYIVALRGGVVVVVATAAIAILLVQITFLCVYKYNCMPLVLLYCS